MVGVPTGPSVGRLISVPGTCPRTLRQHLHTRSGPGVSLFKREAYWLMVLWVVIPLIAFVLAVLIPAFSR